MTTTTDDTERALYRAICANPDEDTPRLVYADWLQEHGDEDRAEFIRVQCESELRLSRLRTHGETPPARLEERESALLAANRERWLSVNCPCKGKKVVHKGGTLYVRGHCDTCDGTCDETRLTQKQNVYHRDDATYSETDYRNPVTFARGFPYSVGGCRLGNVLSECHDCSEGRWRNGRDGQCRTCDDKRWHLTPWIRRVFQHHGTIRRVPLVDRVPYHNGYGWSWFDPRREPFAPSVPESANLPGDVFDAIARTNRPKKVIDGRFLSFDTTALANDALATAVADICRPYAAKSSSVP